MTEMGCWGKLDGGELQNLLTVAIIRTIWAPLLPAHSRLLTYLGRFQLGGEGALVEPHRAGELITVFSSAGLLLCQPGIPVLPNP